MPLLYEREVPNPKECFVRDPNAELVDWQGRRALRLSGEGSCLAIVPDLSLTQGRIEVDIGSEGTAFPGIAFRILDTHNYELAYAQPHTSGKWDALQYDPVFHGSNTWQLYVGAGAHQTAEVPPNSWHTLKVEFRDRQAIVRIGDQQPLLVPRLAHVHPAGRIGLWTYKPAHFSNLRIWDEPRGFSTVSFPDPPETPPGVVTEWFLEGYGSVECESGGILNLNRYLPIGVHEVRLVRRIEMPESGKVALLTGFSDEISIEVDDRVVFTGVNVWHDTPNWNERGYVSMDNRVSLPLSRGIHNLAATLKASEFFGFGMALKIEGDPFRLLPADLHG